MATPQKEKPLRAIVPPEKIWVWEYTRQYHWSREDCAQFFDHHTARNWVLSNGRKMADWEAAARTWNANRNKFSQSKTNESERQSGKDRAIIHDYRNE